MVCLLVFGFMLSWDMVNAGGFYVIPTKKCCTCKGTLVGTRWCDNGDGTVTDLLGYDGKGKCLVWLKDASWGEDYSFWVNTQEGTNAHDRAAELNHGVGGLSDGSVEGDWRLPTKIELYGLANGTEAVRWDEMRAFTGVENYDYWSSSTVAGDPSYAWSVYMYNGVAYNGYAKSIPYYVWPVRGGN
ncbi:MAG: DUF1566 domain-containing protein [Thermodesulfobacteriota bacterium]|nr:DUF1566 domain-containing protein [Thermodesulfobacteriota bacterium]